MAYHAVHKKYQRNMP